MSPDTYLVSVGVLNQSPFQLGGREGTSLNWTRRERDSGGGHQPELDKNQISSVGTL